MKTVKTKIDELAKLANKIYQLQLEVARGMAEMGEEGRQDLIEYAAEYRGDSPIIDDTIDAYMYNYDMYI